MDLTISAAARALAAGDPLGALNRVALRDDAPALALRGIAMAQLGDLPRARTLVRSAARRFGPRAKVARARCMVAEAEIALAARDLKWPLHALDAARATLEAAGDRVNAAHARYLASRRLLLIGRLDEAQAMLDGDDAARLPPALRTAHELVVAGIAMRRVQADIARAALHRAGLAAQDCGIPALCAEVERAVAMLHAPAVRLIDPPHDRLLRLDEVQALRASDTLVIDGCRHTVGHAGVVVALATRPVLFKLMQALGLAWPGDASREALIAAAFRIQQVDGTDRARLRVEVGRLRMAVGALAQVRATSRGYALIPHRAGRVALLARPLPERYAAVLALLADGQPWSSSGLAVALGASQRTMQRALETLAAAGKIASIGHGRARRWMMPVPEIATMLLLPPFPDGD